GAMGPVTSVRSGGTDLLESRDLELRGILEESVRRHRAECILLSGGLDTCVLAHFASPHGLRAGVTVLVGPDAPDGPFASAVARRLGLRHHVVDTSLTGLLAEAEIVVRTLVTFDPMEVRNSIVVARALREARRLAFPDLEASWRRKDPIEVGSGSARLPAYFQERISIENLAAEKERIAREDRFQIRDAEHLAYYRIFQRVFGDTPPLSRYVGDCCSKCGFPL